MSDTDELRSLLDLADKIQGRIEARDRTVALGRFVEAAILIGAVFAGTLGAFSAPFPELRFVLPVAAVAVAVVYTAILETFTLSRLARKGQRDIEALARVLSIAQDAAFTAMRNSTPLEQAEMAVRLAQFEIPRPPRSHKEDNS